LEDVPVVGNDEVELGILRWRKRALDRVLWVVLGIGIVPILVAFLVSPHSASLRLRLLSLGIYLLLVAVALARQVPHQVRGWGFVLAGFGFAGMAFAATGLHGAGRLFLVALPLHALVLLGPRSGYVAAAMSLTIYALAALLGAGGALKPDPFFRDDTFGAEFWLLQGAMLLLVLGPILVLVNRFVGLLQGALAAERAATGQIAEEARERHRLERVLLETGERERRDVGHQLHDGPCQEITAALLRCKVAENLLAARGSREEIGHIRAIAEMLDSSVGEIHDLARGLSPADLSPGALASALSDLARRVHASGGVECDFVHDGLAEPEAAGTSSQLFQIAREAVSNAIRHGKPRQIRIELARNDGTLRLVVRDDGVGLLPDAGREGMGLRIMRHRAELMGGSLSTGPAVGGGTVVTCTLPFLASGERRGGEA
jgi:signal transduction histidine kinase